jgi:peptidoglycan hydrolase-like protein with peptidoglycan-binding domain
MRKLLCKRITARLTLAALAAGGLTLPAVAQGSGQKSSHPSTAHHSAKHSSATSPTKASSGKSTASKTSAVNSSAGKNSTGNSSATRKSSTRKGKSSRHVKGQAAPTSERVNEIQGALAKSGSYSGAPTGKWDDSTVDAMRKFQSAHGLNPTGKMDAPTLQKLGLGSETAGAGAPTPPPNSANRLLSSSTHRD